MIFVDLREYLKQPRALCYPKQLDTELFIKYKEKSLWGFEKHSRLDTSELVAFKSMYKIANFISWMCGIATILLFLYNTTNIAVLIICTIGLIFFVRLSVAVFYMEKWANQLIGEKND